MHIILLRKWGLEENDQRKGKYVSEGVREFFELLERAGFGEVKMRAVTSGPAVPKSGSSKRQATYLELFPFQQLGDLQRDVIDELGAKYPDTVCDKSAAVTSQDPAVLNE